MLRGHHVRFMCDGLARPPIAGNDSTVPFRFRRPTSADVGGTSTECRPTLGRHSKNSELENSDRTIQYVIIVLIILQSMNLWFQSDKKLAISS